MAVWDGLAMGEQALERFRFNLPPIPSPLEGEGQGGGT